MKVESVVVCLLVLVLACSSAAAVAIQHNRNFSSGLVLTCTDGPFPPDSGVSFQRNGVDIQESGGGTLSYPLTQENEGTFICTHGGNMSDPITLAAVPPLDFPLPPRSHYVFVPVSGSVPTELSCDIQPGVARDSYSIRWVRLNSNGGFTPIEEGISQDTFSLTLPVTASSNSTVYGCTVTIDHDGNGNQRFPYDGASITIRTAVEPPLDFPQQRSHYVLVPMSSTVSTQLSCDIGPAESREIQWKRLNSDGTLTPIMDGISQENFNLTLNAVNSNSNGTVYRCTVTIDLGGNLRSYNGASIILRIAVEPSLDFPLQQSHCVLIPMNGSVYTQLNCDIRPGTAGNIYTIQWNQLDSGEGSTPMTAGISQETFSLSLPVNISSDGTVYMCTVTIDYGGNLTRSYDGARITLQTAVEAQIIQHVSSPPSVEIGQSIDFLCEATGDSLMFEWLFDRRTYKDCPEHDNFCVRTSIRPDVAGLASGRSQLSIRDTTLLSYADSPMAFSVVCQVSQNLPSRFNARLKSSEARLVLKEESIVEEDTSPLFSEKIILATIFSVTAVLLAVIVAAVLIVYIRRKYMRKMKYRMVDSCDRPAGAIRSEGVGSVRSDDGEPSSEEDLLAPAIPRPIRSSRWSPVLLAFGRKELLAPLLQFVPRLRVPLQPFKKVLLGVRAFFGVLSHSSLEGYTLRHVEGQEHPRLTEEEDQNKSNESASGTCQDCQVLVQY